MSIGYGMIGCGGIARDKHMPSLVRAGARIVGFFDVSREAAEKAKADFGAEGAAVYDSVDALLADPAIEAVSICTPNNTHADLTVRALRAGKNVLCEKPMAMNAAEAKRMLDAAEETGKKLTIGYQGRFRREARALKEMCENGDLGEIYFARAHAVRRRGVPTWGVFRDGAGQGGGCIIDIGTHARDLAMWLMDNYEPESVLAATYKKITSQKTDANPWGSWDGFENDLEDSAFAFIRMKNGAAIELECSWALNFPESGENGATLCGTKGGASLRGGLFVNGAKNGHLYTGEVDVNDADGTGFAKPKKDESCDAALLAWVNAVENDTELVVKPEQAYTVVRIIDAIYESARTGRAVMLS